MESFLKQLLHYREKKFIWKRFAVFYLFHTKLFMLGAEQLLTWFPHGSITGWEPFYVFVCSPCVCVGCLHLFRFPPTVQGHEH